MDGGDACKACQHGTLPRHSLGLGGRPYEVKRRLAMLFSTHFTRRRTVPVGHASNKEIFRVSVKFSWAYPQVAGGWRLGVE